MATTEILLTFDGITGPGVPGAGGGLTAAGLASPASLQVEGKSPRDVTTDVKQVGTTTDTIQWTLQRNPAPPAWQEHSYICALVIGIQAPGKTLMSQDPAEIFSVPDGETNIRLSTIAWAAPTGSVSGTPFTYLLQPKIRTGIGLESTTWSLDVDWQQVNATGLVRDFPHATDPNYKKSLIIKYRLYCYTTSSGLWYVDPELDLCPQG